MTGYVEPPRAGTEAETLIGSLERQRATFAFKCEGLTAEQLRHRIGSSEVTIGGLLKHLAHMEDLNVTHTLAGHDMPAVWRAMPEDDPGAFAWSSAADDSPDELYALWADAVERSRGVVLDAVRTIGPGGTFEVRPGVEVSVRRQLVDLIEEYARHTGHADLIREDVDGRVGEDPPGERRPFTLP
ncbi:DUF664 domain-containing protein [Oryzobacter terrae]|uniref:mycothiol transferase n=1 Tax=Oryzobacter terrae TaxID=1620385 RepID=UPI003670187A